MLRCCEGAGMSGPHSGGRRQSLEGEALATPRHIEVLKYSGVYTPMVLNEFCSKYLGVDFQKFHYQFFTEDYLVLKKKGD